ncbi:MULTISPECIES: PD-(D/E)XK nuclease family protein [unclassified Streptomyces]|uniref:PD-(D/E)XK nuclease family protein n=1 Tax=unclassified Streptomyces TaxID=2593676 RepID=UPI002948C01D|nr:MULTISPECIES: PD-(D/E)XK nuclease family protein [unclassified Streptomyces]
MSGGKPAHDGLVQWTEHALATYRAAFPSHPDSPMVEEPTPWAYRHQLPSPDRRGAREYRITVWGRCLRSADGTTRELRLPVNRLRAAPSSAGHVAAAAFVLAEGRPGPKPARVRVVEFALLDGQVRVLFEGTRTEALEAYRSHGSQALAAVLDTPEYRPGSACAACPFLSACPALRKAPGLLTLDAPGRTRRTWSVTNGRNYRTCPARDHLRRLRIPAVDAIEKGADVERGRAVHAYLATRHGDGPTRPCTADIPERWVPEEYELSEQDRALGALLLSRHAAVCPLRQVRDRSDVRPEARVVRYDSTADVVAIAAPDLLYRDGGSWVWRETKTSLAERRGRVPLLERYPQLALGVALIARGDLGGDSSGSRIELETLRPGGADLEIVDPFDPGTRTAADKVLKELTDTWHGDSRFEATPGKECARCEMARWCSAKQEPEVAA